MVISLPEKRTALSNYLLWIIFIFYILLLSFTINRHELWGDEIHSWNIAKASPNFSDLISNSRYEGHPPVWYVIMWTISKFTHNVACIQFAQLTIATLVVFLVLFFSSFPLITRMLVPFGYFFLFEYGVLSRNYAIGVLFALSICLIMHKNFKGKNLLYFVLLFLLSNTHLIALLLACSLHFYFLLLKFQEKKKPLIIACQFIAGILIFLPGLYFIFPPSDSQLNTQFWLDKMHLKEQFMLLIHPPLRAFVPIPAWWEYNFWNTNFLIELQNKYSIIKIVTASLLLVLFGMIFYILKNNKKSLFLFVANLLLSLIVSFVMPLTAQRYAGFVFIGFIASYWLYCAETPATKKHTQLIAILLIIQLAGSFIAITKDIKYPFSNTYKVTALLNEVPQGKKIVTDYWTLNALVAFTDKPFYVLEMHREMSFLKWDTELKTRTQAPDFYSEGIRYFFQKEGIQQAYMISIDSPKYISDRDPKLFRIYNVVLIDKREGSIVKDDNLYLYQISAFDK
ncbi:MAG TPA: hypothetical protein VFW07_08310 [Parafilimonas sp.]|nr:hypothetical protein [Parafilimonas sp.]